MVESCSFTKNKLNTEKDSKITVIRYRQGKYELKTRGGYSENLRSCTEDVLQRSFSSHVKESETGNYTPCMTQGRHN